MIETCTLSVLKTIKLMINWPKHKTLSPTEVKKDPQCQKRTSIMWPETHPNNNNTNC